LVTEQAEGGGHRIRLLVVGIAVLLTLGYMVYAAFPGNALYFLTVSEFVTQEQYQDGSTVRVAGTLVEGSFHRIEDTTQSFFHLADKDSGPSGIRMRATYVGILPDLFFNPHSEIILQGHYQPENVFQADTVLVKCPSKYKSLEDELEDELEMIVTEA
jgi:cytochrome c-type biogenesis protein CcmE